MSQRNAAARESLISISFVDDEAETGYNKIVEITSDIMQ
jgi:hypothetical protein